MRPSAISCIAAAIGLGLPATAGAARAADGTLTYVKDGNVYVSPAAGGAAARITSDGSATAPYGWGSQSSAGLVVAARGATVLRRAQSGQPLGPPFELGDDVESGGGISPDGRALAYVRWHFPCKADEQRACLRTELVPLVAGTAALGSGEDAVNPVWANDTVVIATAAGAVRRIARDRASDETWIPNDLSSPISSADAAAANADGTRLVVAGGAGVGRRTLTLVTTPGFGGAPTVRCVQSLPGGPEAHPVWSPDGTAIAWEEADGIWTEDVVDLGGSDAGCAANRATARLVVPGGSRPQWSAAAFDPRPLPDRDGDGLPDPADGCPDRAAAAADGCPPGGGGPDTDPDPDPRGPTTTPRNAIGVNRVPSLSRALRRGLRVTVICPAGCRAQATARLAAGTARRLGLRKLAVGRSPRRRVRASALATVRIVFAPRARRALARAKRVRLTVAVTLATDSGRTTLRRAVTLRRGR